MRAFSLVAVLVFSSVTRADTADELLRLVPAEATVCFIAQDVRGHAARIGGSPFAEWFQRSPWVKRVSDSDDWKRFAAAQKVIGGTLGVTPEAIRDGVFGDAVVYAYLPGSPGKHEADAGVLLARASDADLLTKVVANLNAVQLKSGEVSKIVERTHSGLGYTVREKTGDRSDYFAIEGGLLIYSSRERPLKLALERKAARLSAESPPFAHARKQLGFESAAFVGLFAPRSIDLELKAVAGLLPGADAKAFLQEFAKFWAAVELVGVALEIGTGVEISLGFVTDRARLPEGAQAFLTPPQPSAVWAAIPADAILAVGGHFRWNELVEIIRPFLGEAGRAKVQQWRDQSQALFGRDVLPKLLSVLGPDWGGWVASPAQGSKTFLPAVTVALRVPAADSPEGGVRATVAGVLDFVVKGVVFPSGLQPSSGLCGEYLLVSSSSAAVEHFPLKLLAKPEHAGLMLRFSATHAVSYINQHGTALAAAVSEKRGRSAEEVQLQFAALAEGLGLFKTWELRHAVTADLAKFTLRIEFVKPLK